MPSFPAHSPDYAAHFAIAEHLSLDAYHHIIASHALAAAIRFVTGCSLTFAMFFVFACSVIAMLAAIIRDRYTLLAAALFTVPLVMHMSGMGFYPQVVSLAPYAWSLRFLHDRKHAHAAGFALLGALFYPDIVIWLLPAIAWQARRFFVLSLIIVAPLFVAQAMRLDMDGAASNDWRPQVFLALFLLAFRARRMRTPAVFFFVICTTLVLISLVTQHDVTYYAKKNFYALALLVPFMSRRTFIPVIIAAIVPTKTPTQAPLIPSTLSASFDEKAERAARSFVGKCEGFTIVPEPLLQWQQRQQVMGFEAILPHGDQCTVTNVDGEWRLN